MPKVIELTIELEVQKVSCPGVWLCQDGRVSLSVFALGTSYQTCLLPPYFPLLFKDVFYFRKRFQESCALNNICCLLKDETIYCELIQWSNNCMTDQCVVLAQYLGSLNDVLFPPQMCSLDGVDLLMRRSKAFPGILAPKIEIATKVRIDEVWNNPSNMMSGVKVKPCHCCPQDVEPSRQRQVCHSAKYHRNKCYSSRRPPSASRSRSRSRSNGSRSHSSGSRSCCSLDKEPIHYRIPAPDTPRPSFSRPCSPRRGHACHNYCVYNVDVSASQVWRGTNTNYVSSQDDSMRSNIEAKKVSEDTNNGDRIQKLLLESRYIEKEHSNDNNILLNNRYNKYNQKISPCVCEICKRYHELFHTTNLTENNLL